MAEVNETATGNDEDKIAPRRSLGTVRDTSSETLTREEKLENGISNGSIVPQDKGQELPELIRDTEGRTRMMPGLPSINLAELIAILRDPNMPAQKIMQEVADQIMLKSEESESDDGSVDSTGGIVGMKGLLDCILKVSFEHPDSDSSDDEDESSQKIPREIPCNHCDKVFESTMAWKTHVLVAHQDPSVLNIRRMSTTEKDRKEKNHPSHRKHTRGTSKPDNDVKDTKVCHASNTANKQSTESPHGEENEPSGKKHLSVSRSVQKEISEYSSCKHQKERESLPTEKEKYDAASSDSGEQTEGVNVATYKHETLDSADNIVTTDPLRIPGTNQSETSPIERVNSPTKAESQLSEHVPQLDQSRQERQNVEEIKEGESNIPSESQTSEIELRENAVFGRKRRATSPFLESTSSTSSSPSLSTNPKRSRTLVAKESASSSTHEHNVE